MKHDRLKDLYDYNFDVLVKILLSSIGRVSLVVVRSMLGDSRFNYGVFAEISFRNKMLAYVNHWLVSNEFLSNIYFPGLNRFVEDSINSTTIRTKILKDEALRLAEILEKDKINYAYRKGFILDRSIYGDRGLRAFNDIDMYLPDSSQSNSLKRLLADAGYVQGKLCKTSKRIVPLSRKEQIRYMMSPDHLPKFYKKTESVLQPFIEVDVALELSWRSSRKFIKVDKLVDLRRIKLNSNCQTFSESMLICDTILHCYREAMLESHIKVGADVNLLKLMDILSLFEKYREEIDLEQIAFRYGVEFEFAWAFYFINEIFQISYPEANRLISAFNRTDFYTYLNFNNQLVEWNKCQSFKERLLLKKRSQILQED